MYSEWGIYINWVFKLFSFGFMGKYFKGLIIFFKINLFFFVKYFMIKLKVMVIKYLVMLIIRKIYVNIFWKI